MDINADGCKDILSGCYSQDGYDFMVGSFWVLYGDKDGKFAKPVELKGSDGKTLMIHSKVDKDDDVQTTENICTRPFAADFNGDGKLDIVTGNLMGNFFLFRGEGDGSFQPEALELKDEAGEVLCVQGFHSDPFVIDWDGDGDLDLLSGSACGDIFFAENKGKDAAGLPKLAPFKVLVTAPDESEERTGPAGSVRIHVADFNGDGKLDILAGDSFYGGGEMRADLTAEQKAEYEKLEKKYEEASARYFELWDTYTNEYEAAVEKAGDKLTKEQQRKLWKELVGDRMENNEEAKKLRESMQSLDEALEKLRTPEVSSGNVWVYTQK